MQNTPAVANETVAYSETADLAFAFEDVENLQAVAMTDKQMAETQGAALPLAFVALATGGGAVGAWSNHYNSYKNTGQFASTSSTLRATGKGALTGASLYGGTRVVQTVRSGKEIKIGNNFRIAPFGNGTGHPIGKFPHYHRRGLDANGVTKPGQGIGRHRPWETKVSDKSWRDRF